MTHIDQKKKRTVKAWAMIGPKGQFYTACAALGPLEAKNTDGDEIVICTITYEA